MKPDFLIQMQNFVAESATGPSAVRNQGVKGLIPPSNAFFKKIVLKEIPDTTTSYNEWLDKQTLLLRYKWLRMATQKERDNLPRYEPLFGAARKVLNLFLRSAVYNHDLRMAYGLHRLLPVLEVPIDSYVAACLRQQTADAQKPLEWLGVKWLTCGLHAEYQETARKWATEKGFDRVHLDIYCYRVDASGADQGSKPS